MEWVETTGKSVEEAREAALDQLGVAAEEAEFTVVEEPRAGLFGRMRGEARVRARVKPAQVRPKQDRRRRTKGGKNSGSSAKTSRASSATATEARSDDRSQDDTATSTSETTSESANEDQTRSSSGNRTGTNGRRRGNRGGSKRQTDTNQEQPMSNNDDSQDTSPVSPQEVGDAACSFMDGLTDAFGVDATSELQVDGSELDVTVQGEHLGLLVGSGGRTLNAIQDLARVAAQRRLGDHDTRLRIDVAGYRARRAEALSRFARDVAASVRESGTARSLEPMSSADRKIIHDVLNEEEGVGSRSEGDDPDRRVVVVPA
jgi:spoIIIJ-associated protein